MLSAIRPDTLLVSLMQLNNETGIRQPLGEIAAELRDSDIFFHVDAAQGYGKELESLRNPRIDMLSISGHKIYGPKGVGALVARRRGFSRIPLAPILFGGGQERGLRPGTAPVPQIVGMGEAAALAEKMAPRREEQNRAFRDRVVDALSVLNPAYNGSIDHCAANVMNCSFPGLDSEAVMVALKDLVGISNGSACTSASYTPSHVLEAMGLSEARIRGAVRLSWCHMTDEPDWEQIVQRLSSLA